MILHRFTSCCKFLSFLVRLNNTQKTRAILVLFVLFKLRAQWCTPRHEICNVSFSLAQWNCSNTNPFCCNFFQNPEVVGKMTVPTFHTLHALWRAENFFANVFSHAYWMSKKSVELTEWLTRTSVKWRRWPALTRSRSTSPNGSHVLVSTCNTLFYC